MFDYQAMFEPEVNMMTNNFMGNQAVEVYMPITQFDIDEGRLLSLGFTYPEIHAYVV